MSEPSFDREYSTNIIHESLGGTTEFWGAYTAGELVLFLLPPLAWMIVMGLPFVPADVFLPLTGLVIALEVFLYMLHQVRPRYYRLTEWLRIRLSWALKKSEFTHGDGTEDTRQVTRLERIAPFGIERVDGAYLGAVEVQPANMALEDADQWKQAVQSLTDLAGSLEGVTDIYLTTREVDNHDFIDAHRQRVEDEDARRLPIFRGVLLQWVNRYTDGDGEVDGDTEMHRDYYIIVSVTDSDIEELERDEHSTGAYLEDLPGIGRVVSLLTSSQLTAAERESLKKKKLEDRMVNVTRAVNSLYRCRSRSVSPFEFASLLEAYWSDQSPSSADLETTYGLSPISHGGDSGRPQSDGLTPSDDDTADPIEESTEGADETDVDTAATGVNRPGQRHRSIVAPPSIDWAEDYAVIDGDTYARAFWIETFPEHPANGLFERVLLDTDLQADITIHIDPYTTQSAIELMSNWISSLKSLQFDRGELEQEDIQHELNRAKHLRQLVRRNHESLYRAGVFIRLTAHSEEALRQKTNQLETLLRDAPANCTVKRATRRPEEGLVSVSPIGANELGRNRLSAMSGEALGSMFPFSSNYLRMAGGIEYGTHGHNDSRLLIDPWALETGHSELITGMPGGGKTHGAQARAMRMLKRRSDVKQVFIDPVGDMRGSAEWVDAKTVTVSGDTPLNPCEMHETPAHVLDQSPDMDPVSAKKDEVYGVIENFFEARGVDLEMHSGLISFIIDRIFADSAIDPDDPSTHTPANSPTMGDFLELLEALKKNPGAYSIGQMNEDLVREYAQQLEVALYPFEEGSSFGNLSQNSNLDLRGDDKAIYLDLQQIEGTTDGLGKQSFVMQLLLSTIYQQAKTMDQKVEVFIDEAHYLFDDDANLAFLNQIARHQRHAGLRLVMLSQTLNEFYDDAIAEEIAGMCPIKVHHREPELSDSTAAAAGLTNEQQYYIQHAEAGKESIGEGQGYSEALVRVDEHGDYPTTIETAWEEKQVIELDTSDRAALEEVMAQDPDRMQEFEEYVYERAMEQRLTREYGMTPEQAEEALAGLSEEQVLEAVSVALEKAITDGGVAVDSENGADGGSPPDRVCDVRDTDRVDPDLEADHSGNGEAADATPESEASSSTSGDSTTESSVADDLWADSATDDEDSADASEDGGADSSDKRWPGVPSGANEGDADDDVTDESGIWDRSTDEATDDATESDSTGGA